MSIDATLVIDACKNTGELGGLLSAPDSSCVIPVEKNCICLLDML